MTGFRRNDVVVCIGVEAPCCGDTTLRAGVLPQPILRRFYRVGDVGQAECNACGAVLLAFVPTEYPSEEWSWPQMLFKKIEPSTVDIFKMVTEDA